MKHPSEKQLIEYRYGDAADPASLEKHLGSCYPCRASYQALESVLAALEVTPVPERDASYGSRVWQQVNPRLGERVSLGWRAWLAPQRWVLAAAMAALVLAAFLAGRFWPPPERRVAGPNPQQVRERILLVAVGDHLDRAAMVLVELVNTQARGGEATGVAVPSGLDISGEKQRAQELVAANRLFRQTAARTGDAAVASVLDELERVLLEIAHSPEKLSSAQLEEIRRRIEARGILFKVRVIGSEVREREKSAAHEPARGSS
jgi:hypothetical protein